MPNYIRPLRSLIFNNYDTESAFAKAIGWPRQRLNKITTGKKEPSIDELNTIAKGLNKSLSDLAPLFLNKKSPNRQQNKEGMQ